MMTALIRPARATLATAVLLSVPAFAVCSLVHGVPRTAEVEMARGDDPIRNGLRIVDTPAVVSATERSGGDEVLVTEWTYTGGGGKGKPSPYR